MIPSSAVRYEEFFFLWKTKKKRLKQGKKGSGWARLIIVTTRSTQEIRRINLTE